MLRKPDGGSRGFGFVTYKDEISVEKCLVMQHQLNGRTVELKRAIKKEDMGAGGGGFGSSGYGGYGGGGGSSYGGQFLLSLAHLAFITAWPSNANPAWLFAHDFQV